MTLRRHFAVFPLAVTLLLSVAATAGAEVRDAAGFFSEDAVRQATFDLREAKQKYGKELLVETFPTVPADMQSQLSQLGKEQFFEQWARQRAREAKIDGVAVLVTKDPRYVHAVVGDKTRQRAFTVEDRKQLLDELLTAFRAERYDEGLLGAVKLFRERLARNLGQPAGAPPVERSAGSGAAQSGSADTPQRNPGAFDPSRSPSPSPTERPGGGGPSFWTLVIWGIVILIVIRLIARVLRQRRSHPQFGQDPRAAGPGRVGPYGQPGPYGQGGGGLGGFGTGLGGGLLGGLLGGWIGGRMFGHDNVAHGAPPTTPPAPGTPAEPGVFDDGHDSQ